MPDTIYVIFAIDDQVFAIAVPAVERVIRAASPACPLDAPDLILGLINIGGDMIPLVNIRRQFGLVEKQLRVSDRMIIVRVSGYHAAFAVDEVIGVDFLQPEPAIDPDIIYPEMRRYISGMATFENRTVFIYDIDTLIPPETMEQAKQVIETA